MVHMYIQMLHIFKVYEISHVIGCLGDEDYEDFIMLQSEPYHVN